VTHNDGEPEEISFECKELRQALKTGAAEQPKETHAEQVKAEADGIVKAWIERDHWKKENGRPVKRNPACDYDYIRDPRVKDYNALINLCAKDNERLIDLYADRTLRKSLVADIEVREDMLPTVNRHDGLIAFRGHIVSIHDGQKPSLVCYRAATFDTDEPDLASEYEVRAYINCDFREELLTAETFDDITKLCPKFVKIASDQGFDDIKITWNGKDLDIAFMLYGALGRVLFKNHQFDNMQFMPWLWDESGTGKTVIRDVIRAFFARSLRSQISCKSSGDFGMEKLLDKAFIMWKDVGNDHRKVSLVNSWRIALSVSLSSGGPYASRKMWMIASQT
jgi:hypothetical protein